MSPMNAESPTPEHGEVIDMQVNEEPLADMAEVSAIAATADMLKRKIPVGATETIKSTARTTTVKITDSAKTATASVRGIELPKVELPKIELPKMELPKVEIPKVELPKFDMPKFDMPKFEMPKFELPKVSLPKVEMPSFSSVTDVKAEVGKVAHDVRGKAASAVTLVREAVGI